MGITINIGCREEFTNKAVFVFKTLLNTLAPKTKEKVTIGYGSLGDIEIVPCDTDYFNDIREYDIKRVKYFFWKGKKIPILFYDSIDESRDYYTAAKVNSKPSIPFDIISSAFFFLSQWQELHVKKRDKFDRFPYSESYQKRMKIALVPIVNEYMYVLKDLIDLFSKNIKWKPMWPSDKKFVIFLSHDVDSIWKWTKDSYKSNLKEIFSKKRFNLRRSYWLFEKILNGEKKLGATSTFFFLSGMYNTKALYMRRLFEKLEKGGWEVGFHGGFDSYNSEEILFNEFRNLDAQVGKIMGTRQHFLRFSFPKTFLLQEKCGMEYDSTIGFAENEGYRTGFAFPYNPYNHSLDREFSLMEIPLNVMDTTLLYHKRMNVKNIWKCVKKILEINRDYNGCLSILWHLSSFDDPFLANIYWKIINWTNKEEGICLSGKEVVNWWTERYSDLDLFVQ
ncbi:MAG: hypothetical protein E3J87_10860 [Candidatus Cloacimonadota bacterium]|nr:MAG: hypothetical protein E3J87_10860 [Candidatus Cloacimonadota bacterium]